MKRITLTIAALSLCGLAFVSCKPSKKQMKDEIVKECTKGAAAQFTDPKLLKFMNEYCECAGEKATEKLSVDEIKAMNDLQKQGKTAEFQAKLLPIVQPCLDEMKHKMEASGGMGAPGAPAATDATNAAPPANGTTTPQ